MSDAHNTDNTDDINDTLNSSDPFYNERVMALKTFILAPTWGEIAHVLLEEQTLLLADVTLTLLRTVLHYLQHNDMAGAIYLKQHVQLLEDARVYGLAHGWRLFEQQREQKIMLKMIAHLQESFTQTTTVQVPGTLFAVELFMNIPSEDRQQVELHHYNDLFHDALSYPLRHHRAVHHVHVVDILERHQQLLEQAFSWNEEIIQARLLE